MEDKKMAYHVIEGKVVGKKEKIGIVCARFNEFIVSKLLGGAVDGLVRHGISEENIDVAWVPGAFEIPLICEIRCSNRSWNSNQRFNKPL